MLEHVVIGSLLIGNMDELEVKSYKKLRLDERNPKNAVLYILDSVTKEVTAYITDKNGNPRPLKDISYEDYEFKVNKQNNLDLDGTGTKYPTVDAVNQALSEIEYGKVKYFNFNNVNEVVCTHLLNKIPSVTVLIGTEEVIANIEHTPDMNECTIRFSQNYTGQIIIQ